MREILPVKGISTREFLKAANETATELVAEIRRQKRARCRPHPSSAFIDRSAILTESKRHALLNKVADLVDEAIFGRSDMCFQFADLLERALSHLGLPAKSVVGIATYRSDGKKIFFWKHAWVTIGEEVVDGNSDCIHEHPPAPPGIKAPPYWGPISGIPTDRSFQERDGWRLPTDDDVNLVWWPALRDWLDRHFQSL